ncbi:hypothetical protein ACHAPJ_006676 [Fusarium lateritium]
MENAAISLKNIASSTARPQTTLEAPSTLDDHTRGDIPTLNDANSMSHISPSPDSPMAPSEDEPKGDPGVHVVFCDIGGSSEIAGELGVKSLKVTTTEPPFRGAVMNNLTQQALAELQTQIGSGLCSNNNPRSAESARRAVKSLGHGSNSATFYVHGIVLTLLWAEEAGYMSVEFRDRQWLQDMLSTQQLGDYFEDLEKDVLLFTHMRRPHMTEQQSESQFDLAALDTQIELANAVSAHPITTYPSQTEARADRMRISDIRILDEIAKAGDTPDKYGFRPKVCYGRAGECQMKDFKGQMIVRGDSTTGPGTTVIGQSEDAELIRLLKCTVTSTSRRGPLSKQRRTTMDQARPTGRHFHQELIPTLLNWGEIHVIMVGSKYFCACIRHGKYGDKDSYVSAVIADRCFKEWKKFDDNAENVSTAEAEAKMDELEDFCRWWRAKLIKHRPELFQTFKVAVRFDIGISKIGADAQFFINEMPRWSGADFMSSFMDFSYPYDEICQAIGQKFAVECGSIIEAERQEMKDGSMSDSDSYGDA